KLDYEKSQREFQKKRVALRTSNRPENEMNDLFRSERAFTNGLFSKAPNRELTGAFEGANYQATGYYRSAMQCLMFHRSDRFCRVCQDAIVDIIDLYSRREE